MAKSAAREERAMTVSCPSCYARVGERCHDLPPRAVHKQRVKAVAAANGEVCACLNHMGTAKQRHKTREAAVAWAAHASRHGMRMEFYECPTAPGVWHVRTARRRKTAA